MPTHESGGHLEPENACFPTCVSHEDSVKLVGLSDSKRLMSRYLNDKPPQSHLSPFSQILHELTAVTCDPGHTFAPLDTKKAVPHQNFVRYSTLSRKSARVV